MIHIAPITLNQIGLIVLAIVLGSFAVAAVHTWWNERKANLEIGVKVRQAIVELGDQRAKQLGIFQTSEYQSKRATFLADTEASKNPTIRLQEYELYLKLLKGE